jgi:multidrug efflux pump
MRHAMGVAVFAGMIGVTLFGIFLTPVFYVLLRQLAGNRPLKRHGEPQHDDGDLVRLQDDSQVLHPMPSPAVAPRATREAGVPA